MFRRRSVRFANGFWFGAGVLSEFQKGAEERSL
jgi:hypothetical protein